MRYCKKCIQPDTRPGIAFYDGVCAACRYQEEMPTIDWSEREKQLRKLSKSAKRSSHCGFDCVVGVSGGKDSHFQALYAKERLGLRALLVNCAPDHITKVGRHNLENLVQHGFDMISFRPNPHVMRAVTRQAFFEYGNPVKPSEYPLYAVSYQTALTFEIPLIIQGENPAITLGIVDNLDPCDDALNIRHHNTLAGGSASDWIQKGIELEDLQFYQFPDTDEMRKRGIRAIHLNYYVKEWSRSGNTEFAVARGLRGRPGHDPNLTGRLNPYSSVDSDMQIVNQMLKYYKFGFGFVTDEVCYDIREARMSREDGINLVEQYDGKCDEGYIQEFCEYIDISVEEFWSVVDRIVNRKFFRKDLATGKWMPLFRVGYGLTSQ
ncbi:MAG: N-acetyl sugar amidotransferase [Deltaproteobacteria bacterium]|nr:N-acetyl sugar amidotransferase [Deltaproteobacteria bacterium]